MRLNSIKFGFHQKVEFQKFFELNCQISLKVLAKVGLNFVHFAWMNEYKI
jgi:hypothetical protein